MLQVGAINNGSTPFTGKQNPTKFDQPGGIGYTPSSGIWQTVWLEQLASQVAIEQVVGTTPLRMDGIELEVLLDGKCCTSAATVAAPIISRGLGTRRAAVNRSAACPRVAAAPCHKTAYSKKISYRFISRIMTTKQACLLDFDGCLRFERFRATWQRRITCLRLSVVQHAHQTRRSLAILRADLCESESSEVRT